MQNHGGYDLDNGTVTAHINVPNTKSRTIGCYLSLIRESDMALEELMEYFSNQEENTMIVFFGDHLPALPTGAYQELLGEPLSDLLRNMETYQTPFIIWTNYSVELPKIEQISANYLGSIILDVANLKVPLYQQYLLNLYKKIPVVGYLGCYDSEGNYYKYNNLPDDLQAYLDEYECMQYENIK